MALYKPLAAKLLPLIAMGSSSRRNPLLASTVDIMRAILSSSFAQVRGCAKKTKWNKTRLTILKQSALLCLDVRVECQTWLRAPIGVAVKNKRPRILAALVDILVGHVQKLLTIV